MRLLAERKLQELASQVRRSFVWRLPRNRCKYDANFSKLPQLEAFTPAELNGRLIDDYRLQELAMAPSDGSLEAWFDEDESCLRLEAKNSMFIERGGAVQCSIVSDGDRFLLRYDSVLLASNAPPGFGATAFYRSAQAAKAIGLNSIELEAVGGQGYKMGINAWWRNYNGYYSWPRFGFDAEITQETRDRLKGTTFDPTCTQLLQLMEWDADWWKKHGAGGPMVFDLTSGSRSWHTLTTYLLQKGLLR